MLELPHKPGMAPPFHAAWSQECKDTCAVTPQRQGLLVQVVRQCRAELANGNGANGSPGHGVPSAWPGRVVIPEQTSGKSFKVSLPLVSGKFCRASAVHAASAHCHGLSLTMMLCMCRNSPSWAQQVSSLLCLQQAAFQALNKPQYDLTSHGPVSGHM